MFSDVSGSATALRPGLGWKRGALRPLVLAMLAGGMAGPFALAETAYAQNAPQAAARSYQIAAGPLGAALNQFAAVSGIFLSGAADLTAGKQTAGLQGNHSVSAGLARLLQGTGLEAQAEGGNRYSLRRIGQPQASADSVTELSGITVEAALTPADESATNYTVSRSSSASKLNLALKETPQTITVFTEKLMEDLNATTVNEVMTYAPGVTVLENGVPGAGRVQYFSRGFAINSFQIDGLMTDGAAFGAQNNASNRTAIGFQDTFLYERIDIIRGSSGLTTGQGDPSASLSLVRKRPLAERQIQANLKYGSWDNKRGEFDLSTPINESGSWRTRIVATGERGHSYMDRVKHHGHALYAISELDVTASTRISVGATQLKRRLDGAGPHGLVRATNYGDPTKTPSGNVYHSDLGRSYNNATQWSYRDFYYSNTFATLNHVFANDWEIVGSYNHFSAKSDRFYGVMGSQFYLPEYDVASYVWGREKYENATKAYDVYLKGDFGLLGRRHDFVAGYNQTESRRHEHGYLTSPGPVWPTLPDVDDPRYAQYWNSGQWIRPSAWNDGDVGLPPIDARYQKYGYSWEHSNGYYQSEHKQNGIYASLRLRPLEHLQVIVGGRYGKGERMQDQKTHTTFSPYAGLIYELTPSMNAYAGYARVEKPNVATTSNPVDINGVWLKPLRANTIETGIKAGFFEDRLNLAATYFTMTQDNFPIATDKWVTNPDVIGYVDRAYEGVDGYRIYGVELSLSGQVTPHWQIMAGYVNQHQKVPFDVNNPPYGVAVEDFAEQFFFPKNQFKLFTTYDFLERFTVGGGVTWQSGSLTSNFEASDKGMVPVYQGSYALWNLMARWRLNPNATLGLNVNNVFDKVYFTNASGANFGTPRNVTASISLSF
ncbi:TonB-dependent siderophore receptor [Kerstersia sp.]|uniref:TonB-dependent siderophore receptor n=1 Tax=Kerstersia sp. TaxID=1930783 RepID=UPI003F8F3E12